MPMSCFGASKVPSGAGAETARLRTSYRGIRNENIVPCFGTTFISTNMSLARYNEDNTPRTFQEVLLRDQSKGILCLMNDYAR